MTLSDRIDDVVVEYLDERQGEAKKVLNGVIVAIEKIDHAESLEEYKMMSLLAVDILNKTAKIAEDLERSLRQ